MDIRSQLVLEITEQELLSKEALERKTSKGFLGAVALDDYGSGYNSEKSLLALYLSRPAATPGAINPDALKIIEENRKR